MEFRTLRADEIDVRVAMVRENGASLLLYKDARCDMNILDETVGPYNWQRQHTRDNANCIISIWDEDKGQWVSKEDTGTESYTEKEKGLASDSFKRASFNWGIGRELYTSPFIWINAKDVNLTDRNGKPTTYDRFSVEEISYKDKKIVGLKIKNENKKKTVFAYGYFDEDIDNLSKKIGQAKVNLLKKEVERIGMADKQFLSNYKKDKYEDFTEEEWLKLYPQLQKLGGKNE